MLGALALVLAVVGVMAPLAPAAPAAAAPPPAGHSALVHPSPVDNTPHVIGDGNPDIRTEAVLDLGSRVIVGGVFEQVKSYRRPERFTRRFLFAYDKATGDIDQRFDPVLDGRVSSLLRAPDGNVLVGGQFKTIDGRAVPYVAKINPTTGAPVTSFAPRPSGMVYDMHLAGGLLYFGGTFTTVGGTPRPNFAVVDVATGALRGNGVGFSDAARPTETTTRLQRFDISPDGTKLVALGNFTKVGGQTRENVAVLDLNPRNGNATVSSWRTREYRDLVCGNRSSSFDMIGYDIDLSPDGRWFVIVTTGGWGGTTRLCDTAARWDLARDPARGPTWANFTGGDSLTSVAITDAAVYIAGHQRWLNNENAPRSDAKGPGAVDRVGIGALSPSTGRALSWNPGRAKGQVTPRLVATAEGLWVLNDTEEFAGEWHPKLSYLTFTGTVPTTPPPPPPPPPPGTKPSAPGTPTVTAATATTATVSWGAATATSAITGYRVVAKAGAATLSTTDVGTARSATITGLPAGGVVTFTVTARTSAGSGPAATSAPAVPPFATVDAFTTRQIRDLVGRAPTAAELADWRARVGGGQVTPQAAVDQLMDGSAVGELATVVRLYRAYYERPPDTKGFRYWRDEVRRGKSVHVVSQNFADAPEFRKRYGSLDDGAFVDLVYRNVLDRYADASGRAYWVSRLRGGLSRGKVMTGFSESLENKRVTKQATDIVLVLQLMLDRAPSATEKAWTGTRAALVRSVLASAEYDQRV